MVEVILPTASEEAYKSAFYIAINLSTYIYSGLHSNGGGDLANGIRGSMKIDHTLVNTQLKYRSFIILTPESFNTII